MRSARMLVTALLPTVLFACSDSTTGTDDNAFCAVDFGDPAASAYVLPFPVGVSYRNIQTYCFPNGGHRLTFAYDFDLDMGDPIIASRAGTVIIANDQFADTDHVEGHENNVFVEHADGTVIRYTHLMQGSVTVSVGQTVAAGDTLGLGGASGNTGGFPHLHFGAFRNRSSFDRTNSIPISFRNADGPLDANRGLVQGARYTALPF